MAKKSSSSGGFGKVILGFLLGIAAVAIGLFCLPEVWGVAGFGCRTSRFPFEEEIVHVPLGSRIDREMKQPPFGTSEDVYEAGAHIYRTQCASCHGTPGHDCCVCEAICFRRPRHFGRSTAAMGWLG